MTTLMLPITQCSSTFVGMADKVARALNLGADRDLLDSADGSALLDLIDEYLDDPKGI